MSSLLIKSAALMACLSVLAAPALGVPGWRCADGQPCPLTTATATPNGRHAQDPDHSCCPPQPCDDVPLALPDPAHCVLETAPPATLVEPRAAADLTLLPVFILAPAPLLAAPAPDRPCVWAVVKADDSPPVILLPEQGPSPRSPPAGR